MKTKWNMLVILALLFMLVGNVTPAKAETVPTTMISNLIIVDSSGSVREPSYVGESIYVQANIVGMPASGVFCLINYGGDMGSEDVYLSGSDTVCKSQVTGRQYPAPGTYTITMTLFSRDGSATQLDQETITHEVVVGVGDIVWVDRPIQETTTSLLIGEPYTIKAPILGYYDGLTCGIFFGDGTDSGGTLTVEDDVTWCSANTSYDTAGVYTVEIRVYASDGLTTVASNSGEFTLSEPSLGVYAVFMLGTDHTTMLEPSIINQAVIAVGFVMNQYQYALIKSCTVDYGDGGGDEAGLMSDTWPTGCLGPEHTYTTPGTYSVTVTVTGFDDSTAEKTSSHQVLPLPVLEQLPSWVDGIYADSALWGWKVCTELPCSGADNVVVPQGSTLTISHIQLWGSYLDPSDLYVDDFTVIIHQDESGLPGDSIYTGQHVPSLMAPTYPGGHGLVTLTLAQPQTLQPGTYWIEIYNNNGTVGPDGYPINAFGWVAGDPDNLGSGPDGFAVWDEPTQKWEVVPVYNLSLRLFSPPASYSISGKVFNDQNTNGAFDTGEPGLANVNVELHKSCGMTADASTSTGTNGSFSFTGQEAGQQYCVWVMPPEGYKFTLSQAYIASLDGDVLGMDFGLTNLHLFTWTPATPNEGGSATFTAVDGFTSHLWKVIEPEAVCDRSADWLTSVTPGSPADLHFGPSGNYQVCVRMYNGDLAVFDGQLVTVANVAPSALGGSIYPEPSEAGQPITDASASFLDADHLASCTVDYGDGTTPVTGTILDSENVCEGPAHTYAAAGTYTVTFTVTDPDGAEGTLTVNHVVNPSSDSADLSLTKVDNKDPVKPGDRLVYTLTVKNIGPSTAETITLVDTLDRDTNYVSFSAPKGWRCQHVSGKVTCTRPQLASGSSATIKITVTVSKNVRIGKELVNNATVSSVTNDPVLINNSVVQKTLVAK